MLSLSASVDPPDQERKWRVAHRSQIEHFEQGFVAGEYAFSFLHFRKLPMVAFNDVGCINELANLRRVFEERCQLVPVLTPGRYKQRILASPDFFKPI